MLILNVLIILGNLDYLNIIAKAYLDLNKLLLSYSSSFSSI